MQVKENIKIALGAIRSQSLRAVLTILIIAIGIMALVGILTSIDAIKNNISTSFSAMGSNSFTIRNRGVNIHVGGNSKEARNHPEINYHQAIDFKKRYAFSQQVSVSTTATRIATLKYESIKTNPNIWIVGADDQYLNVSGYTLKEGRNISSTEMEESMHVCLLGNDIAVKLFSNTNPIDKIISVGTGKYRVIGTLEPKGSSMGIGSDRICILPLSTVEQYYSTNSSSFAITIKVEKAENMQPAIGEATGLMRSVRRDPIKSDNSFEITQSDAVSTMLIDLLGFVQVIAVIIAAITLLGAAIGLMNIMLVSVTERTREIGIRKALGATQQTIREQFLSETLVICFMGGIAGIILGILIGNLISILLTGSFILSWFWIFIGLAVCFAVGVLSGLYPAVKAARLDPIEALRHE